MVTGGKSSVLMDVKPWDDETDMKKLEEAVRSVQMEGLLWGACKLIHVSFHHLAFHPILSRKPPSAIFYSDALPVL